MTHNLPPQSIWCRTAPASAAPGWSDAFPLTPIITHLEASARADPHAPALIGPRERLDVSEVLHRVREVGAAIRDAVPPGQAVATLVSHTPSGLAALVGCAASGRTTIPINPADPPERLAYLLRDSGAAILLTDKPPPREAPAATRVLQLQDCNGATFRAFQNIDGMRIERGGRVFTGYDPESSAGFCMIVSCLVHGAAMLVATLATDGVGGVLRLCAAERATLLTLPSPMLGTVLAPDNAPAALAELSSVRLGAAPLPHADYVRWRARLPRACVFSHSYASTEATRLAEWVVPENYADTGPVVGVGRMRPGHEFAIVSDDDTPVPAGEIGELILRGRHIAVGEWQNGGLTTGRMPPDPSKPATRVFRTGDLVRLDDDGMLHFAGRADRQIKINGVRIEPAEIEAVIRADAAVHDAAVILTSPGGLHAFVAAPDADPEALRQALAARMREALPPPLRPRRVSVIASLPTLPGGKLDIQTLRRWADADHHPK